MKETTAELVRRMKLGDEAAFDSLYESYVRKLYGMAFLISGSKADSEDIVQEAFVTCFLKRDSLREEAAFERWLYQILVRTAWRYGKRKKRYPSESLEDMLDTNSESFSERWVEVDKAAEEPLDALVRKEERERLLQAVQELEIKQRTVIVLYYFNDCPVKEIARITGALEGTVKSRLHNGRENLRRKLENGVVPVLGQELRSSVRRQYESE